MSSKSGPSKSQRLQKIGSGIRHGGRKLAFEWSCVNVEGDKTTCSFCDKIVSKKIERIRDHLKICEEYLLSKKKRKHMRILDSDSDDELEVIEVVNNNVNEVAKPKKLKIDEATANLKQPTIKNYISTTKTTEPKKKKINEKIAAFFYASGLAFRQVESATFKDMISELREGYTPPNRNQLAGVLLDEAHDKIVDHLKNEISSISQPITIMQDGWSSLHNDPILATSIHTGKDSYFISAIDCEENNKTAEYCANNLLENIEACKTDYGKDVFAVCTDNENKMVLMRKMVQEKHPDILVYGCSAHYLNLVENQSTTANVIKHVVEVNKFFRNHHKPHGLLKKRGGKKPQLPNDTRWNSQIDCLQSFIDNYQIYRQIVSEYPKECEKIEHIIENVGIYNNAFDLRKQLEVVGIALDKLQGDSAKLSDCVYQWKSLLQNETLTMYKENIKKRIKEALTDFHYLAYMTDLNYSDEIKVSNQEEEAVISWLGKRNEKYVPFFMKFLIEDDELYPKSMFVENMKTLNPSKWWQILYKRTNDEDFKEFCLFLSKIHSCPTSSASLERIFSTFGHVWTKLRNRLESEKVYKLVKIYRFLNKKENHDW